MRKHSARFVAGVVVAGALVLGGGPAFAQYGHVPVEVCHKPGSPAEKSLTVDESAVPGHLGHGDYLGECVTAPSPSPTPEPEPTPEPTDEPGEPEQPAEPEQPEEPTEEPDVPEVPAEPEAPTEPAAPITPDVTPASPRVVLIQPDKPTTLAETGGTAYTPWIAGVALALLTAGFLTLRRARIKGMTE